MIKTFVLIPLMVATLSSLAQNPADDLDMIRKKSRGSAEQNVTFKGLLKLYNQHFTDQILNDCVYEHSCSTYSQGAMSEFGPVKGLLMTCDRLSRCNRATLAETSPFRLTKEGRIKEHWDEYKKPD